MTVVQTLAGLESVSTPYFSTSVQASLNLYNYSASYAAMYRTQSNVRTVCDFLAENMAQLGLHAYQRVSDTDRARLADHPLDQLAGVLNPWTTRYRLVESMVLDLCIYGNCYLVKVKAPSRPLALLRVPPQFMSVRGVLMPTKYVLQLQGDERREFDPAEVVHFRGHNPDSLTVGLSPLETLRGMLAEDAGAIDYRAGLWRNGARMSGLITRPATAPEWAPAAQERFLASWKALTNGQNVGGTAVLEEGMTFQNISYSAEDSQYLETRKLTREEVARAYHVPLPMVGILDHATFSNIQEQHKNLYQDCLGPWCEQIQEELELQLLPEFPTPRGVYLEFNIQDKLKGSFEEQAASLSAAVGRPWLTADEARARQNLPSLGGDAAALVTPLNVLAGGQSSPQNPVGPNAPKALPAPELKAIDPTHLALRARHAQKWQGVLEKFFERQRSVVLGRLPKGRKAAAGDLFNQARWDRELAADLLPLSTATATVFAKTVADALGLEFDPSIMGPWLKENARIAASGINAKTLASIRAALLEDDELAALGAVFDVAAGSRAAQISQTKVTNAANFGAHDAADHLGLQTKTWRVNSSKPRPSHARANGQTVKMSEDFSPGGPWPGFYGMGPEEVAGCTCSVTFG